MKKITKYNQGNTVHSSTHDVVRCLSSSGIKIHLRVLTRFNRLALAAASLAGGSREVLTTIGVAEASGIEGAWRQDFCRSLIGAEAPNLERVSQWFALRPIVIPILVLTHELENLDLLLQPRTPS